jgi:hypothetical protein
LYDQKTKALKNLNEIELKLNDFQQLYLQTLETKNPPVSINLEIETLKELLNEEEIRLKKFNTPTSSNFNKSNNYDSSNNISHENLNENGRYHSSNFYFFHLQDPKYNHHN